MSYYQHNQLSGNPFEQKTHDHETLPTRKLGAFVVRTNLPDLSIFDKKSLDRHPHRQDLLPSATDALPAGVYRLGREDTDDPAFDRVITVREDDQGKYVSGMTTLLVDNLGGTRKLMRQLGYRFGGLQQGLEAMPTPQTFKSHAAELGVQVRLYPQYGLIEGKDYLDAFANGEYPVATGTARDYAHDTSDDHITAMVLGAEPLRDALVDVAHRTLAGEGDLNQRVATIDEFTACLRGTVADTYNFADRGYGRDVLVELGRILGIGESRVNDILDVARNNARDLYQIDVSTDS